MPTEAPYDYIIVGSGIAGLYMATELLRLSPRPRVAIYEKHAEVGGRVYTFHKEINGIEMQWEGGAGRISEEHTIIMGLLKRYKLTWSPIGGGVQYKDTYDSQLEPNAFEPAIPIYLETIAGLPAEDLAQHTIRELLTKVHGPVRAENYLIRFPYRAEIDVMRADAALDLFRRDLGGAAKYGVCVEGLSALTGAMRKDIEKRGGKFHMEHKLVRITKEEAVFIHEGDEVRSSARHYILALTSEAISHVKQFENWETLKHLRMTPLLRFYGSFPKDDDGKIWYENFGGRIVTATPVRYIIPGNPANGSMHMSYTDTQDAQFWIDKLNTDGEKKVGEEMLAELRKLLRPSIPPPRFVKAHAWAHGVTYWLPGNYSPKELSKGALTPFPKELPAVHVCGESFSLRQGWMEGAVEHAAALLKKIGKK